jgi:hypothetical protein
MVLANEVGPPVSKPVKRFCALKPEFARPGHMIGRDIDAELGVRHLAQRSGQHGGKSVSFRFPT